MYHFASKFIRFRPKNHKINWNDPTIELTMYNSAQCKFCII
jgi:hypothetical protein